MTRCATAAALPRMALAAVLPIHTIKGGTT